MGAISASDGTVCRTQPDFYDGEYPLCAPGPAAPSAASGTSSSIMGAVERFCDADRCAAAFDAGLSDLLASARGGIFLAHPEAPKPSGPFVIDNSVIIISNPKAGSGKAARAKGQIITVMEQMEGRGELVMNGEDTDFLKTKADPRARVLAILDAIKKSDPSRPPIIVVLGGDGTFADVAEAVLRSSEEGFRPILVPGPGGTAGDMRIELGVPRDPRLIPEFLATAKPVELSVVTVKLDGGEERLVVHSQGNGVSGAVFDEVQNIRSATGRISVMTYVRGLVKGIAGTDTFYVKVNGGEPIAVGEVLALSNSTSIGSVARVPLPPMGGCVHAIPVIADMPGPMRLIPGVMPVLDVARRGSQFMLGDQRVVAPGERIGFLDARRIFPLTPGGSVTLDFVDKDGSPRAIPGILNGDPTKAASSVVIECKKQTIASLAAPDSGIMVRRGLAAPRSLGESFGLAFSGLADRFGMASSVATIAGYEVWKDVAGLSQQEARAADAAMFAGIFTFDSIAAWRYGATPFLAEMPLVAPPFAIGSELAAAGADALSKETGVKALGRGSAGGRIAGLAGGTAATYGAIKLVGADVWSASASAINVFLVRALGGAGEFVESFVAGAARLAGSLRPMFPIIMLPGIMESMPPAKDDPRSIPAA